MIPKCTYNKPILFERKYITKPTRVLSKNQSNKKRKLALSVQPLLDQDNSLTIKANQIMAIKSPTALNETLLFQNQMSRIKKNI